MVCNTSIHRFKSGLRLLRAPVFRGFLLLIFEVHTYVEEKHAGTNYNNP